MRNILLTICFFLLTFNLIYASNNQDVIVLKDGTTLKGEILEDNNDFVLIKTSLGEIKIERKNIKTTPVTIYLKDDNIIKGNLIRKNETSIYVKTSIGSFEIELKKIKKIVEEKNEYENKQVDENKTNNNENELGLKTIGNALLYQQRQKKISTALGFQALGAGLLYTEKYTMGTIMLLAENGLLISSAFVDDPEVVPYLFISGLVLKGINTFFTIKSVNDYNNRLAEELYRTSGDYQNEIKFKTKRYNHSLGFCINMGLFLDYSKNGDMGEGAYIGKINNNSFNGLSLNYGFSKKGSFLTNHIAFKINSYSGEYKDHYDPPDVEENDSSFSMAMYGLSYSLKGKINKDICLSLYSGIDTESLAYIPVQIGVSGKTKISKFVNLKFGIDLLHFVIVDPGDTVETLINTSANINLGLFIKL